MNPRTPSPRAQRPAPKGWRARLRATLDREVVPVRHKRGAALIVVLLTVAVMTTVVIDFVYSTRVQLHMAANQRDQVRAYFLARSGVDLARLALGFQRQVDTLTGGRMNIQIWQYLDQFMGAFNAARVDLPVAGIDLSEVQGLGGIKGAFEVNIEPEDGKINLGALANRSPNDRARLETIARMSFLMAPGDHKDLFESRDTEGGYNDIPEIIAGIIDWIDPDEDLTTMNAEGMYMPSGGGAEANRYRKVGGKVKPRNMKPDSLEELHRVKGVGDEWFERFGDSLTIYPGTKVNVNAANEQLLAVLICSHVVNPADPLCSDPFNMVRLWLVVAQIRAWQMLRRSVFMMTPFQRKEDFVSFLRAGRPEMGFAFDQPLNLNWTELKKSIEVRPPAVYRIRSVGRISNTETSIVAVIDLSKKGRLYYWREF